MNGIFQRASKLTTMNQHTEARILLAKYYKHYVAVGVFEGIAAIHSAMGSLDHRIADLRNEWTNQLLKFVEIEHGQEEASKAYKCL